MPNMDLGEKEGEGKGKRRKARKMNERKKVEGEGGKERERKGKMKEENGKQLCSCPWTYSLRHLLTSLWAVDDRVALSNGCVAV